MHFGRRWSPSAPPAYGFQWSGRTCTEFERHALHRDTWVSEITHAKAKLTPPAATISAQRISCRTDCIDSNRVPSWKHSRWACKLAGCKLSPRARRIDDTAVGKGPRETTNSSDHVCSRPQRAGVYLTTVLAHVRLAAPVSRRGQCLLLAPGQQSTSVYYIAQEQDVPVRYFSLALATSFN